MSVECPEGPLQRLVGRLLLRCPKCRREMMVDREPTDYPEAVCVEVTCPECNDGDFAETMHFDAAGKHITRDPDEPPNARLTWRRIAARNLKNDRFKTER